MKAQWNWFVSFLISQRAVRTLRIYVLALAFVVPGLTADTVYADATNVPQTFMGPSAQQAQAKLGNLGNFLVSLSNKAFMIGVLAMLLAGILGAILWAFGQRGIIINVLGGIVFLGLIVMLIGLIADNAASAGGTAG
jgi:hypothetical protein